MISYQAWYDFYPMFAAETGGKELVENGKATFNSAAGDAVAAFWQQLYAENLAGKEVYTSDPFADWHRGHGHRRAVGHRHLPARSDWGVVPVPTTTGSHGDQVPTFSDAKNIAMYASCKNRGTAWDFLKFSTSEAEDGKLLRHDRADADAPGDPAAVRALLQGEPGLHRSSRRRQPT